MVRLKEKFGVTVSQLTKEVDVYLPNFNKKKFIKAFEFAKDAHEGQMREQNLPYITHPLETAAILTQLRADETTLIAALLHDVPEDTDKSVEDVEKKFGPEVGFLVEGITKLSKVYYRHNMKTRQVESLKKLLLHSAKDPRVVLIKLADRLHNMRTLDALRPEKRERIARETLEIHVPIANLLGIEGIKSELEDLCFKYLYPKKYDVLQMKIISSQKKQKKVLEKMLRVVKRSLKKEKIDADVQGRQKTLYSIYKKITSQGKTVNDVDDRIALRVVVNSRDECYIVLGIIHDLFKPKPARFKDYIAVPKNNGYRSIHTTVFGVDGIVTEFQIRTHEMHLDAEYGIAAHYFYKEPTKDDNGESHMIWAQRILELQKGQGSDPNFLENLKLDVFQDRIFIFTPKGDVIDLPRGATGIDFAYAIHSDVGNNASRIEINGESFSISTTIPNNATVRVITSIKTKGPDRKWLDFAKTQQARQGIREFLKKEDRDQKLKQGYESLSKEFERAGLERIEDINFKKLNAAIQRYCNKTFADMDSLIMAIGDGSISTFEVIKSVYPNYDLQNLDETWHFRWLPSFFRHKTQDGKAKIWLTVNSVEKMGQAKRILSIFSEQGVNILKTIGLLSGIHKRFIMKILVEVSSLEELSKLCDAIEQLDGVYKVERISYKRKVKFYVAATLTFIVWLLHPFIMKFLVEQKFKHILIRQVATYLGLFLIIALIYSLKRLSKKTFSGVRYVKRLWLIGFIIMTSAFLTMIGEIYFFKFEMNWLVFFAIMTFLYSMFTAEYLRYVNKNED